MFKGASDLFVLLISTLDELSLGSETKSYAFHFEKRSGEGDTPEPGLKYFGRAFPAVSESSAAFTGSSGTRSSPTRHD